MKIVQLYNQQRSLFGGEETVVATIRRVLERNGHQAMTLMRSSRGAERSFVSKASIALSGIYNPFAYREMERFLETERPDIVHVHSVYPNYSPSVLAACRAHRVPVLFHVHCHILTCPNWYHLRDGKTCERCFGGHEQWCLLTNCRGSLAESAAYSLRSVVARKLGLFRHNVTLFLAVSQFLRDRLILAGYPPAQVEVLRNAVTADAGNAHAPAGAGYIGFAGRLSHEKGVDTLLAAARVCALPVKIAGDGPEMERLRSLAPPNVEFLGRLDREQMSSFYRGSRLIVSPSRSFEGFPLATAEAMMMGKPVIANCIGALPELIEDGVRGLLVPTDDHTALAGRMNLLWNNERLRQQLGSAAKAWAEKHCNEEVFYATLLAAYERARSLTTGGEGKVPVPEPAADPMPQSL
jgi:glycosyltransferase involved in cell wall biosynthesis